MTALQAGIRLVGLVWLAGAAAAVAIGMLKGTINARGVLTEKRGRRRGRTSPERVQLLLATLAAAASYVSQAVATGATGRLPEVSAEWLALLGGSNGIYLASKAVTAIRNRATKTGP